MSTIALFSSTRTLLRATSRARRSRSFARSGTLRGPARAWLLPASSAGRQTRPAVTSRSPTVTSTTSAPSGGRALSSSLATSTRALSAKLRRTDPRANGGSLQLRRPSTAPTSRGPLLGYATVGAPAESPKGACGPNVAVLSCSQNRKISG